MRYFLSLTAPPVEFLIELTPITVEEKEKAEFFVEISDETAEVTWLKDGKPITAGGPYKMTSIGKKRHLIIKEAELPDQAVYTCTVRDKTSVAELVVERKSFVIDKNIDLSMFKVFSSGYVMLNRVYA